MLIIFIEGTASAVLLGQHEQVLRLQCQLRTPYLFIQYASLLAAQMKDNGMSLDTAHAQPGSGISLRRQLVDSPATLVIFQLLAAWLLSISHALAGERGEIR